MRPGEEVDGDMRIGSGRVGPNFSQFRQSVVQRLPRSSVCLANAAFAGAVPRVGAVDGHVVLAEVAAALAPSRAPLVLLARPDRVAIVPAESQPALVLAGVIRGH